MIKIKGPKETFAEITRSPGVVVSPGYIVGGGYQGLTKELDNVVAKEAELLREHFGMDVTIRFNSDRLSGGAWIVDSSKDSLGSNSSIGLGAMLVNSTLKGMHVDDIMNMPSNELDQLRHKPDTIIFTTAIDLEKTEHSVDPASKHILMNSEYCHFYSLEDATHYLFSHVFGLKNKTEAKDHTWFLEVVQDFDGTYYANMYLGGKKVEGLPEYVDYRTLQNAIKSKTGVEILKRKDMIFQQSGRKKYAYIDATQVRKDCRVTLDEMKKGWRPHFEMNEDIRSGKPSLSLQIQSAASRIAESHSFSDAKTQGHEPEL